MAIRSTRHGYLVLSILSVLSVSVAAGCGSSVDTFDEDTGVDEDAAGTDGGGDGTSLDTKDGAPMDSGSGDSAIADADTGGDTNGSDTSTSDTASGDTAGSDTGGSDTTAADSGVDTTPVDSGVDTAPVDSGVDVSDAPCPAPVAGSVFVSPFGDDTAGNGSSACPFVTITKALSTTIGASGPTTINVASGAGPALFVYGVGCSAGAGKCDATPIRITDGMNKGIIIKGSGLDPSALTVVGGVAATDTAVFAVTAPNVGFENLTIAPRKLGTGAGAGRVAGAAGIRFNAPAVASGSEAAVTNVVIDGVIKTSSSDSTASGIELANGTSPTIGPGVTIVGGDHSVLVTQSNVGSPSVASKPTITSSAAAPSFFHSTQFACVRIDSTNAGASVMPSATLTATTGSDPGRLHLQDCGGNGGVVVDTVKSAGVAVNVTNTLIDTSVATAAAYYGIRLLSSGRLVASSAVTITGINELAGGLTAAIEAGGSSAFGTSSSLSGPGVVVTGNLGSGVHLTGNAVADLVALTSTNNRRHGLLCDASPPGSSTINVFLRRSRFTGNGVMGVFIAGKAGGGGCGADLGSGTAAGGNVFNTTAAKNGVVGLCYTSTTAASATSSSWGCGVASGTACAPATAVVKPLSVAACDTVGDYNTSAALTVALPQTCCGL